jgi:hypothetical protein
VGVAFEELDDYCLPDMCVDALGNIIVSGQFDGMVVRSLPARRCTADGIRLFRFKLTPR